MTGSSLFPPITGIVSGRLQPDVKIKNKEAKTAKILFQVMVPSLCDRFVTQLSYNYLSPKTSSPQKIKEAACQLPLNYRVDT
jgi:hypothetical protein